MGRIGEAAAGVTLFLRVPAMCCKEKAHLKYSSRRSQYLKTPRIFVLTFRYFIEFRISQINLLSVHIKSWEIFKTRLVKALGRLLRPLRWHCFKHGVEEDDVPSNAIYPIISSSEIEKVGSSSRTFLNNQGYLLKTRPWFLLQVGFCSHVSHSNIEISAKKFGHM